MKFAIRLTDGKLRISQRLKGGDLKDAIREFKSQVKEADKEGWTSIDKLELLKHDGCFWLPIREAQKGKSVYITEKARMRLSITILRNALAVIKNSALENFDNSGDDRFKDLAYLAMNALENNGALKELDS